MRREDDVPSAARASAKLKPDMRVLLKMPYETMDYLSVTRLLQDRDRSGKNAKPA